MPPTPGPPSNGGAQNSQKPKKRAPTQSNPPGKAQNASKQLAQQSKKEIRIRELQSSINQHNNTRIQIYDKIKSYEPLIARAGLTRDTMLAIGGMRKTTDAENKMYHEAIESIEGWKKCMETHKVDCRAAIAWIDSETMEWNRLRGCKDLHHKYIKDFAWCRVQVGLMSEPGWVRPVREEETSAAAAAAAAATTSTSSTTTDEKGAAVSGKAR
jgi:hypothetical protein